MSARGKFPHPYKECSVPLSNRCEILQSTPFEPSVLANTRSFLQLMWDPPIYSPLGPSILVGTPPCVYPLQDSASSLTLRSVSSINNGGDKEEVGGRHGINNAEFIASADEIPHVSFSQLI